MIDGWLLSLSRSVRARFQRCIFARIYFPPILHFLGDGQGKKAEGHCAWEIKTSMTAEPVTAANGRMGDTVPSSCGREGKVRLTKTRLTSASVREHWFFCRCRLPRCPHECHDFQGEETERILFYTDFVGRVIFIDVFVKVASLKQKLGWKSWRF